MAARRLILDGFSLKFVGLNPSGAVESLLPIGLAHVVYPHGLTWPRGMDEFAVTHINAHMAEGSFHGIEENQIKVLIFKNNINKNEVYNHEVFTYKEINLSGEITNPKAELFLKTKNNKIGTSLKIMIWR